jgi:hypothetical protein
VSFEELGESQRGAGVAHYGKDLLRQHYRQHPHDTASR